MSGEPTKRCTRCGAHQPYSAFSPGRGIGGRATRCKPCHSQYVMERRDPAKHRATGLAYYYRNLEKARAYQRAYYHTVIKPARLAAKAKETTHE